ncbi:MAG: hypothetical protein ABFD69_09240 [Candidatus Sumerlaeia bacterium]
MSQTGTRTALNSLAFQSCAVFVAVSLVYWLMRSRGLDDMDSVQFAMGVGKFNLYSHRPHPPGYPLYIFAGKLLVALASLDAAKALQIVSCLGGGLFTAAWFFMCARRFGRPLAWLMAAALTVAPMQWMTATKALTDAPASALIAVELACVMIYRERRGLRWIVLAAAAGAVGAGIRPQNIGILLLILILGLAWMRAGWRHWLGALAVFIAANLAWLIPVLWTQALLPKAQGSWLAYPLQLLDQWRYRLDKPGNYIGAVGWDVRYFYRYTVEHVLRAWFSLGFNWTLRTAGGIVGIALYAGGAWLYVRRGIARGHASFWRFHLPWAIVYFLIIFCTLPAAVRYHLPLLPLLLLPPLAGWWSLEGRGRWVAAALPVMLFVPSARLIEQNHHEFAPPIQAVRYLQKKYPEEQQPQVRLVLWAAVRHAEWYGPRFKTVSVGHAAANMSCDKIFSKSLAVYTDDPLFIEKTKWEDVKLVKVRHFKRSTVIHHKHANVTLYQVVRQKDPGQTARDPKDPKAPKNKG